ncbi:TetR/AcrR family transcriptional regulator [Eubacterium sp. 1001713B170207_170306_E7]|uniref:TetR/AcrR family transcriptional regulator n=1 Tax=Eubacterium sp. 1001713B170207_170306_E7 TaxID=2787097 RepID=UPI00189787E6|nr:TetR/AcrR family transcriptional regulator [Eubacterium sp. 1001713B170207_170306_E7]
MPKAYSEQERAYIRRRLREEAGLCIRQFGMRKTSVDELVRRVNIPKGTFYLFYPSKEMLFFEVMKEFHDTIHTEVLTAVEALKGDMTPEALTELLFRFYKMTDESILMPMIANGDLELLMRKLPDEVVEEHHAQDDFSVEQLTAMLPGMEGKTLEVFSGALRAVFLLILHKREIGSPIFDDVMKTLLRGVALQLFEVKND